MDRYHGKVAVVTGGGSGIGAAIAGRLASEGAVVVVADVNELAMRALVADIAATGRKVIGIPVDVANEKSVSDMIDRTVAELGRLDVLINNAGVGGVVTPVDEYSGDEWHRVIETNLSSVFYGIKYGARAMKLRAERGVIVNISSILGFVGLRGAPAYVAAKHAIVGLTKSAALDLARAGIRVLAVAPAFVHTPMIAGAEEAMLPLHPIGRLGSPGDVASLVAHLAADESSFLTGATYLVDGGYTAQ